MTCQLYAKNACAPTKMTLADIITLCDHWFNFVQENTCLINENCYEDGEVNPENSFEICDATINGWTGFSPANDTSTVSATTPTGEFYAVRNKPL